MIEVTIGIGYLISFFIAIGYFWKLWTDEAGVVVLIVALIWPIALFVWLGQKLAVWAYGTD